MKKIFVIGIIALGITACGNNQSGDNGETPKTPTTDQPTSNGNPSYDPNRGEGKFTKVDVSPTLDVAKATAGEKVFSVKCAACHKLTDEKLVGPGWKDVTKRHTAEWIMNFSTNTDDMLNKDPKAQAMLEICLVRMPNQNLSDDEARDVYEFMRKNDGVK
ncbi:MAG: cytochrome c [Bacteroidetes bacterium]|nr:cytochrome c [Bacteroidota bacterium]MBS1633129.1 cytochrome c [Bacteroidota bacterium]